MYRTALYVEYANSSVHLYICCRESGSVLSCTSSKEEACRSWKLSWHRMMLGLAWPGCLFLCFAGRPRPWGGGGRHDNIGQVSKREVAWTSTAVGIY